MVKVLTLSFFILLAIASATGYFILTEKITAGRQQIAEGKIQLENGEKMLAQGKAKLAGGKQQLSQAKTVYGGVRDVAAIAATSMLPVAGVVLYEGKNKINEGDKLVARGEAKIKSGEAQLEAGKLALTRGQEKLNFANTIRLACALSAVFFAILAMVLALRWKVGVKSGH